MLASHKPNLQNFLDDNGYQHGTDIGVAINDFRNF
jgi:hypothetical protein